MTYIPEERLLMAILARAIVDYFKGKTKESAPLHHFLDGWLFDQGNGEEIFSFEWICEHLNLNPELIRKRLKRWKQEHAETNPPPSLVTLLSHIIEDSEPQEFELAVITLK